MVAKVRAVAFHGVEVIEVETQVTIASGLPVFTIVGLPDKAVAESRERVRAALASLGLGLPPKRITVNLAPADVVKEGSHFDLPIALGLLAAMEALPASERLSPKVTIWLTWPGEIVAPRATLQDVAKAAATRTPIFRRIVLSLFPGDFFEQGRSVWHRVFWVRKSRVMLPAHPFWVAPPRHKCVKVF